AIRHFPTRLAGFSPVVAEQNAALKKFLQTHVYSHPAISEERDSSVASLAALFRFYFNQPERMPKYYFELMSAEPRHQVICDYVAGMTDHYLLRQYQELLGSAD